MLESSRDDFETSKNGYDLLQNPIFPEFATKMEHIYHKFIGAYLLLKEPEKTGIKMKKISFLKNLRIGETCFTTSQ